MVSVPPSASPISCAWSSDATIPRASTRCTERPPQWYEEHGYPVDAIRHAQAAKDWPDAARLLAESSIGLRLDGRQATVHALLAAFPAEAAAENPELALVFAADRVLDGAFEEAGAYIAAAETAARARDPTSGAGASTWCGPSTSSRWPAGRVISRQLRRRWAPWRRLRRPGRRATSGSATTTERRR